MPHLLIFRKGWENEKLGAYSLSRFSFVAHPTSTADDLGSDFFCTIFEIHEASGKDFLMPRTSFAIQVKSSRSDIPADDKIEYLMALEIPFFIGVVSQAPPELKIYSAELLPLLFSEVGKPEKLTLTLVDSFDSNDYYAGVGTRNVRLRCPLVATVNANDDRPELASTVAKLLAVCSRARNNIATRVNEEHIYDVDGKGLVKIGRPWFRTSFQA